MAIEKTNVMRILDQKGVKYTPFCYVESQAVNGVEVAEFLGVPKNQTFKTLITVGKSGRYYVFDIPVDKELDLRKAAEAVGEKNVAMIKSKELLPLTGYIHGGCSPVGMKKYFTTTFDITAEDFLEVYFSAGKIGYFVKVDFNAFRKVFPISFYDLTVE